MRDSIGEESHKNTDDNYNTRSFVQLFFIYVTRDTQDLRVIASCEENALLLTLYSPWLKSGVSTER